MNTDDAPLPPGQLPDQTIQVLVKVQATLYQVLCPLAMLQVLPALVQAELFKAQLLARKDDGAD